MIVKLHKTSDGRTILAICDKNLLNKKFEEGGLQLDLTSDFYKGGEKPEKEVFELIKRAQIINAVGEKCIHFLLKNKIVSEESIIKIRDIPHVQVVFC